MSISSCPKLIEINFGENSKIETIMEGAFLKDFSLSKIKLPQKLRTIGVDAFGDCKSISELNFSSTVESISLSAFSGCNQISSITVQDGNQHYITENGVLFNKNKDEVILIPNNIESFPIPDTLLQISKTMLQLCQRLTLLIINDTHPIYANHSQLLIKKSSNTLVAVAGGIAEINIPDYITTLGNSCALQLTKISSVTIGPKVNLLGINCFKSSSITSLTIRGATVTISESAFEGCTALSEVYFPESGTVSIGKDSFKSCENLGDIICNCKISKLNIQAFVYSGLKSISFNDGSFSEVSNHAFGSTNKLTSVQLPSTVKTISGVAFQDSKLNRLTFIGGNHVKKIYDNVFLGCSNLEVVEEFLEIESFGIRVFDGCTKLKGVEFSDLCPITKLITTNLFANCKTIKKIQLSKNIDEIEPSIFTGCTSLIEIRASNNSDSLVTKNGILFSKEGSLIICPPGCEEANVNLVVSKLEVRCFYGCSKLSSLTFFDISTFKIVSPNAFAGCSSLEYIRLPSDVENITSDSFIGCINLRNIGLYKI